MTHYLRFPDEATGMAYLRGAGLIYLDEDDKEHFFTASHQHALDVIGEIQRGGEWDEEGNVITPSTVLNGWHVNYVGSLPEGWEQYVVTPNNPVRIFA
jgi:hypothetical protein